MLQEKMRMILLFALIVFAVGCSDQPPPSSSIIAGTYLVNYPHGKESLDLDSSGAFVQTYFGADGTKTTNSGTWWFDSKTGDLYLKDALFFDSMNGQRVTPAKGDWVLHASKRFGEMHLSVASDGSIEFIKK
jgi:hypothetical protein